MCPAFAAQRLRPVFPSRRTDGWACCCSRGCRQRFDLHAREYQCTWRRDGRGVPASWWTRFGHCGTLRCGYGGDMGVMIRPLDERAIAILRYGFSSYTPLSPSGMGTATRRRCHPFREEGLHAPGPARRCGRPCRLTRARIFDDFRARMRLDTEYDTRVCAGQRRQGYASTPPCGFRFPIPRLVSPDNRGRMSGAQLLSWRLTEGGEGARPSFDFVRRQPRHQPFVGFRSGRSSRADGLPFIDAGRVCKGVRSAITTR